jgi:hypothetical protein
MKHLMIYEEFSSQDKTDELLDKISKYGISSLTPHEKDFLDAVSTGDEEEVRTKMRDLDTDQVFEDTYFKFELEDTKYEGDGICYIGTLYVPDLEFEDGRRIEGDLKGRIILHNNGSYALEFEKTTYEKGKEVEYDVFEFCNGLEYELDSFIDYVIQELE